MSCVATGLLAAPEYLIAWDCGTSWLQLCMYQTCASFSMHSESDSLSQQLLLQRPHTMCTIRLKCWKKQARELIMYYVCPIWPHKYIWEWYSIQNQISILDRKKVSYHLRYVLPILVNNMKLTELLPGQLYIKVVHYILILILSISCHFWQVRFHIISIHIRYPLQS